MINSNIALQVRTPQFDPLEAYGKAMSLREMMRRGPIQDAQLKAATLENQERERAIADADAVKTVFRQGGDDRTILNKLRGVSPQAALNFQKSIDDRKHAALANDKLLSEGHEAKIKAMRAQWQVMADDMGQYEDLTPEEQAAFYQQKQQEYFQRGWISQEQLGTPPPDAKTIRNLRIQAYGMEKIAELEEKKADWKRKAEQHKTEQTKREADARYAVAKADGKEPIQPLQQADIDRKKLPNTPTELAVAMMDPNLTPEQTTAYEGALKRLNTFHQANRPVVNVNSVGPVGLPNLKSGTPGEMNPSAIDGQPEAMKALVQKITNYEIPIPSGSALRSPYWSKVLTLASAYDPSFDASQYDTRRGVKRDFNSGVSSRNIRSLNTLIGHLDSLRNAGEKLANSNYPWWNTAGNWAANASGDPRLQAFLTAKNAVAGELSSVFKGTATEGEVKRWEETIDSSQSPAQLKASIDMALELAGSRMSALGDQYEKAMGKPRDFTILSPKSREILKKLNKDPETLDSVNPNRIISAAPAGVPSVGGSYNGEKVLKVTRVN